MATQIDEHNIVGMLLDRFHFNMDFCYGGGTPGVHWGYVFSCGNFGTELRPWREAYFTNLNGLNIGAADPTYYTNAYYFNWSVMGYSKNTGFDDYQKSAVDHCVLGKGCLTRSYPALHVWAHANGEYDVEGSGSVG